MLKKILSLSIVFVMICSMISAMQVSADVFDNEYNFNDTTAVFAPTDNTTDAFHYHCQIPAYSYSTGFSGEAGDSALQMSIGAENEERQGYLNFFGVRNEYGFSVRVDDADASITDAGNAAYAFNANFMAAHNDVVAALIYPGTANASPSANNVYKNSVIYLYQGKLYVGTDGNFEPATDTCIAEPGVGNWFTLGAVFSSTHKRFDVFYNGDRIYGETRGAYTAINRWHVYMHSANETKHTPYNAGEFLYIDNLYVGKNYAKVKGYYPEVISTVPAKDAQNVATDSDFTFNFSIPIRSGTISRAISVTPATEYTYALSNGDKTLTLSFTNGLQPGTQYTVAVGGSNYQSFVYEKAKASYSTTFKTSAFSAGDLYVKDITPSIDATDVDVNTSEIKLTFSEPVNKESANGKISISPDFGISTGEPVWNNDSTVVTIPVNGELYGNSEYTVIIGDGITSSEGAALLGDKRFSFTTGDGEFLFYQGFEGLEGSITTNSIANGMNAISVSGFEAKNDGVQGNYGEFKVAGDWAQHNLYPQASAATPGIAADKTVAVGFKVRFKNEPLDPTRLDASVIQYNRDGSADLNLIDYDRATKKFIARNGVDVIGDYVANEWLEFGLVFNLAEDVVDIYFNGEKAVEDYQLHIEHTGKGLSHIVFRPFNARAGHNYPLVENPSIYDIDDIVWIYDPHFFEDELQLKNPAQQNIEISDLLTLDFNNAVMTEDLADAISVTYDNGVAATIENTYLSNYGKTLRVEVDGGLLENKTYTVTIDADKMKSATGKAFIGNNTAKFLVGAKSHQFDVKFYRGTHVLPTNNMVADAITVQGTVVLMEDNAQIVVARYNGNTLEEVKVVKSITNGTSVMSTTFIEIFEACSATDTIKVFCWDSFNALKPIGNPVELLPVPVAAE